MSQWLQFASWSDQLQHISFSAARLDRARWRRQRQHPQLQWRPAQLSAPSLPAHPPFATAPCFGPSAHGHATYYMQPSLWPASPTAPCDPSTHGHAGGLSVALAQMRRAQPPHSSCLQPPMYTSGTPSKQIAHALLLSPPPPAPPPAGPATRGSARLWPCAWPVREAAAARATLGASPCCCSCCSCCNCSADGSCCTCCCNTGRCCCCSSRGSPSRPR